MAVSDQPVEFIRILKQLELARLQQAETNDKIANNLDAINKIAADHAELNKSIRDLRGFNGQLQRVFDDLRGNHSRLHDDHTTVKDLIEKLVTEREDLADKMAM